MHELHTCTRRSPGIQELGPSDPRIELQWIPEVWCVDQDHELSASGYRIGQLDAGTSNPQIDDPTLTTPVGVVRANLGAEPDFAAPEGAEVIAGRQLGRSLSRRPQDPAPG